MKKYHVRVDTDAITTVDIEEGANIEGAFFDTWEEARNFLLAYFDKEIDIRDKWTTVLKGRRDAALALKEEK